MQRLATRTVSRLRARAGVSSMQARLVNTHRNIPPEFDEIPMGHEHSDLSPWVCNASLLRRKELRLVGHADLLVDGQRIAARDLFKGGYQVVVGLPNRGSVCSDKHVPGYVEAAPKLKKLGIRLPILCISQGSPEAVAKWAADLKLDPAVIEQVVDVDGRLTRYLGLNYPEPTSVNGPKSLRWSAIVDHGVISDMFVEKSPADVTVTSGEGMVKAVETARQAHEDLADDSRQAAA